MFKLKSEETFTWPVKAKVPDGGKHIDVNFEATFRVVSPTRVLELIEEGGSNRSLQEVLVSFKGIEVVDDEDNLIADDEIRNALILTKPYMVNALSSAYSHGVAGYREKN